MRTVILTDEEHELITGLLEVQANDLSERIFNPASQQKLVGAMNKIDTLLVKLDEAQTT